MGSMELSLCWYPDLVESSPTGHLGLEGRGRVTCWPLEQASAPACRLWPAASVVGTGK